MSLFDIDPSRKVGLQLSGGRDSVACLYLMRPLWDRMTVYWLNTGDAMPETLDIMNQLCMMLPSFVEIDGARNVVWREHGMPSDIVPSSNRPLGIIGSGSNAPLIQDRYDCCARTIMMPMHQRMIDDGITLIIRGQKNSDKLKSPIRSGYEEDGIQYLFPIEDWTAEQVDSYLKQVNAPVSRVYEMLSTTPDCLTCPAWWEEGRAAYLHKYHPEAYTEYQSGLATIREALEPHFQAFNAEISS